MLLWTVDICKEYDLWVNSEVQIKQQTFGKFAKKNHSLIYTPQDSMLYFGLLRSFVLYCIFENSFAFLPSEDKCKTPEM